MAHFRVLRGVLTAAGDAALCQCSELEVWRNRRPGPSSPSQVGGRDEGIVPLHSAQVDHGSVVGHLHRLADAGFASLHHLQLVHGVIHAQGKDFVPWQPLPAAERSAKTCHLLPRSSYPHVMYLFIINAPQQWYQMLKSLHLT